MIQFCCQIFLHLKRLPKIRGALTIGSSLVSNQALRLRSSFLFVR